METEFDKARPRIFGLNYLYGDHLGTATFVTDRNGETTQFFLNLPFGEIDEGDSTIERSQIDEGDSTIERSQIDEGDSPFPLKKNKSMEGKPWQSKPSRRL